MYDCLYTCFQSQKKINKRKNARTIACTCISGPGVLLRLMNNKEVKPPVLAFGTEQV